MKLITEIKLKYNHTKQDLINEIAKRAKISTTAILDYEIVKMGIDARKKPNILFVYNVAVNVDSKVQNKLKNFELSILRAQKVRDVLISQGVPSDKIFIDAVADTEKVVEENMQINEAINRRTEVYINY